MLARLAHRGPDGEGARQVGDSWLGHRRPAIVDLEHGGEPIGNGAGDLWLVGDGGLYNHDRLRAELGDERFHSRSDHETALHLFDDEGVDAFERLWGEFAFVIAGDDGGGVHERELVPRTTRSGSPRTMQTSVSVIPEVETAPSEAGWLTPNRLPPRRC